MVKMMNALVKIHTASPGPTSVVHAATAEGTNDGVIFVDDMFVAILVISSRSEEKNTDYTAESDFRFAVITTR